MTMPGSSCTNLATPLWWVVPTTKEPIFWKYRSTALASAEPSSGSVLVPSSSINTREWTVARDMMPLTFVMWELKVDSDCWMLCWSPMSA